MKDIYTLAIETSCDETSVAVLKNGREVLSNIISSQIETHRIFGGVVPEVASRLHLESINQVIDLAVEESGLSLWEMDHVAVTNGPGLIGALIVGVSAAKALAMSLDIPLNGVNHMKGHIFANYIAFEDLEPPFIGLIVSGGHTYLLDVKSYYDFEIVGKTIDDAAGESYDKVARTLGLDYPGGPVIDKLAYEGDPQAIDFPRAWLEEGSYDFSFSGLKTAVLNYVNNMGQKNQEINVADVAASFQEALLEVLTKKTMDLMEERDYKKLILSGGVAANSHLRSGLQEKIDQIGGQLYYPPLIFCTDNAAMIGCAGYYDFMAGKTDPLSLRVYPNLGLE